MKIVFVSDAYPTKKTVFLGIFPYYLYLKLRKLAKVYPVFSRGRFIFQFPIIFFKSMFSVIKNGPDCIVGITGNTCGFTAVLVGKLTGAKSAIYLRGSDLNVFPKKNFLNRALMKFTVKNASCIITAGKKLKENAIRFGASKKKVGHIYTGIQLKRFQKKSKVSSRKKLRLPKNKAIMLYVGSIIRAKGLQDIIRALHKVKNKNYLFIVIGIGSDLEEIKNMSKGLEENVLFLGQKKYNEIPDYYIASDIFISASHSEGTPNTMFEAMGAGNAIIYSDVGEVPYVLSNKNAILIKPRNTKQIKSAIEKLLKNRTLRQKMSKNNLKDIKDYKREDAPKEFLNILEEVIKS